ncbi:phage N-6-adenine-methyltransferase [Volucribacter psittacicida]|uniref:Phage N-6-adenine-methyltransferase n=1 Tax=Volucribacter psittacicida TaxID=203482 RepID=A0A4V2PBV0_9PAST|nr:phage N-6-adenine-methyltransferase [Volucribacter psittacicida]
MAINKSNTKKEDKDLWATPWWLFHFAEKYLCDEKFDLDVCALEYNTKVPNNFITPEQDTLKTAWNGKYCWCNPPYSNPLPFIEKAIEEQSKGKTVVMLLNVDNSTKWFELCTQYATRIVFITGGRVAFIHNETGLETKGNSKGQMLVMFAPIENRGDMMTSYINIRQAKGYVEALNGL